MKYILLFLMIFNSLSVIADDRTEKELFSKIPDQVEKGEYVVVIEVYSEEAYPRTGPSSTKLRDTLIITVNVLEFHDMQIY